jgi:HlyD family secretion protein
MPATGWLNGFAATIRRNIKAFGLVLFIVIGAVLGYAWWSRSNSAEDFVTDKVTRGNIDVSVSATGTVQAVTTVQVGSQVSGTVSWLGADFKSRVTRGQVIAKLEPALFQAQVNTATANVANAQAAVQAAQTDIGNQTANIDAAKANDLANQAQRDDALQLAKQNEQLKGILPDRDIQSSENAARTAVARYSQSTSQIAQAVAQLNSSKAKLKEAQAAVAQAKAQLDATNINLRYATITSPIDGVVVSRSVDVGQTVAASLQAPTLFSIANDLTNMQVLGSIDEADVGQVREGGKANFTVDAYPGQTFAGDIVQLRLNAQTLQNVVTYTAVINVANPDEKLMPGMTANITIPVVHRDNVLRVPNSALRFKPDLTDQQQKDLQTQMDAWRQQQGPLNGTVTPPSTDKSPQTDKPATAEKSPAPQGNQAAVSRNSNGAANSGGAPKHRQQQGQNTNRTGPPPATNQSASSENGNSSKKQQQAASDGKQPPDQTQSKNDSQTPSAGKSGSGRQSQVQVIWTLTATRVLQPHFVRAGITDGRFTEISNADLNEGDQIVIGQTGGSTNTNRPQTTAPFGQTRPPGAGAPRGR